MFNCDAYFAGIFGIWGQKPGGGGGLTPKGKVAKPTHFVFKSFCMSPLIWPSFIEIGEIACITPAWSSGGLGVNILEVMKCFLF